MIDNTLQTNIHKNVESIKKNILKNISLGQFKIINNKKSICDSYTLEREKFPCFKGEQLKQIQNANLLSYLENEYTYVEDRYDYYRLETPIVSETSFHPNQTSFWHRFTSTNTSWTGRFTFSRSAINYIKKINEALKKEGIILTSISITFSPSVIGPTKISIGDFEKNISFNFTLSTEHSFGKNRVHFLPPEEITFEYYIPVE